MPDAWAVAIVVTLGALVVLVGVAMIVPVHVRLAVVVAPGRTRGRARIEWLGLRWRPTRPQASRPPARASPARQAHVAAKKGRMGRRVRAVLSRRTFRQRAWRLVAALLAVSTPKRLWIRARVGLPDPASTGVLYGAVCAAGSPWPARPAAWRVAVVPDFLEPCLIGRGIMEGRAAPVQVLWPVMTFVLSPATWGALWAAYRAR